MYKSRPLIALATLLCGSTAVAAPDWIAFDEGVPGSLGSLIEVQPSATPAALELSAELNGVWVENLSTPAGEFVRVDLTGGAGIGAAGTPRLPVVRRRVAVPYGGAVKLIAAGADPVTLELAAPLWPAQPAQRKCDPPAPLAYHAKAYARALPPGPLARIVDEQIMRGVRHVLVEIRPLTYDPGAGTITIQRSVHLAVITKAPELERTRALWRRTLPGMQRLVSAQLLGLPVVRGGKAGALPDVPIHYVFVLPNHSEPGFGASLQPLVDWKREKGFVVTELLTSEIGTTKEAIKAALRQLYESPLPEEGAPAYVTLVGDVQHMPFWEGTGDGENQAADQYYGTMDAPDSNYTADQVPDFHVGRFSVANPTELATVVRKTLAHELPTDPAADWYVNSLWVASDDHDALARETHEWVVPEFIAEGMIATDAYMDQIGGAAALQITEAGIEAGQSIINYSGHGFHQGWVCVPVEEAYVAALPDTGAYPFVITNACQCGEFQLNGDGDCFSETWLKADGGAVASWAASNNSLWDEDDLIEKAVWAAFLPALRARTDDPHMASYPWPTDEAFTTIGAVTDLGLQIFYERADASWSIQYAVEEYNLLGDPSVDLWSAHPKTVELQAPSAVILGQSSLTLEISTDATPFAGALVAISKDGEVALADYTDAFGSVSLPLTGLISPGSLHVVVTGHNLAPGISDLQVIPPGGAYVGVVSRTWDDSGTPPSVGDGNGRPSPGEVLTLTSLLKNFGDEDATNVVATLSANDSCVTITRDQALVGTLIPGAESTGDGAFEVTINSCDNDHRVDFTLTITSDQDSWVESFAFVVGLAVAGSVVVDATGAPLADAVVSFAGPLQGSESVASDGGFVLQGLDAGDYEVTASHPDYLSETLSVTVPASGAADFRLGRAEVVVDPTSLEVTVDLQLPSPEVELSVENAGDRELTYEVVTRYGNGDDSYGYRWADSDSSEVQLDWRNLALGDRNFLTLDDDGDAVVNLPGSFEFYGANVTSVWVGANGYMNFGASSPWVPWDAAALPSADMPDGLLAVFYVDLDPTAGGEIYWGLDGNDLVVTWDGVPEFGWSGTNPAHTFQVVLEASGGIHFNYASATGTEAIIGIQNLNATSGMNVGNGIHDDLTIAIATELSWVLIADAAGSAAPGAAGVATLSFDTTLLQPGDYNANLRVVSNDLAQPILLVPLLVHAIGSAGPGDPCDSLPNGDPCNDGDACTDGDTCVLGVCTGVAVVCNDGNPCTDDLCGLDGTCTYPDNSEPCDDGNPCTTNICEAGSCAFVADVEDCCAPWDPSCCAPAAAEICADGQLVSVDSCDVVEATIDDCGERGCVDGACCAPGETYAFGACVENDGEPAGCNCSSTPTPTWPGLALLALALLGRRRLRRGSREP